MKSMGVATGCGCKEAYRFPHTTYPYSSCICSFLQQHPYFLFIFFKMFFVLLYTDYMYYIQTTCITYRLHVLHTDYMYYIQTTCITYRLHVLYRPRSMQHTQHTL